MKIDVHKIKLALAERKMTQSELAKKSGISRQSISTILTRGTCALSNAGKLAESLGLPVSAITREEAF